MSLPYNILLCYDLCYRDGTDTSGAEENEDYEREVEGGWRYRRPTTGSGSGRGAAAAAPKRRGSSSGGLDSFVPPDDLPGVDGVAASGPGAGAGAGAGAPGSAAATGGGYQSGGAHGGISGNRAPTASMVLKQNGIIPSTNSSRTTASQMEALKRIQQESKKRTAQFVQNSTGVGGSNFNGTAPAIMQRKIQNYGNWKDEDS
jgi:hypothetical protein